jgi:tRNA(Ile)-lysidine synthase
VQHRNPNGTVRRKLKRSTQTVKYPVPGNVGGRLARRLVKAVRTTGFSLPLASHILCACSGGADSVALAVLLARYGRRVGAKVTLLHVNHGWRGAESDGDEKFVRGLAKKLGIAFVGRKLREKPTKGESWEAHARGLRKAVFQEESDLRGGAPVFTAHSADDQAETRLWRLFTGAFEELGGGILSRHGVEVRPLLGVRREELRLFLAEEKQKWREDSSNSDPRFLRAQMRQDLMPVIERLFPRAIDAINRLNRV